MRRVLEFFRNKKMLIWTERRAADDFFEKNIFSVWHLFFVPLSAIEELFWNLTGVRRSCRPPPPPGIRPWVHPPNKNVLLLTYEYASLFGKFVNTYKYILQVQYASIVHNNKWYIETWVHIALIINRKV